VAAEELAPAPAVDEDPIATTFIGWPLVTRSAVRARGYLKYVAALGDGHVLEMIFREPAVEFNPTTAKPPNNHEMVRLQEGPIVLITVASFQLGEHPGG